MNYVFLIGRLTSSTEIKLTQTGIENCRFTLAVNRPKKNGEDNGTDFISCHAWRSLAKIINQYCAKGSQIAIRGRLRHDSYTAEDGTRKYYDEVIVDEMKMLDGKKSAQVEKKDEDPFADFGEQVNIDANFLE